MNRIFAALLALALSTLATAQTVTVTLSVPMQLSVLGDIHQHFVQQTLGQIGVLSADMDATTTTVSVSLDESKLTAAPPTVSVGNAAVCGREVLLFASVAAPANGSQQITFTRGTLPNAGMAVHSAGTVCFLLKYSSPFTMLTDEALRPYVLSIEQQLGPMSLTFASGTTGTVSQ